MYIHIYIDVYMGKVHVINLAKIKIKGDYLITIYFLKKYRFQI